MSKHKFFRMAIAEREMEYWRRVQEFNAKMAKITSDFRRMCEALGGRFEKRKTILELEEHVACVFPEPVDITTIKLDEVGDYTEELYIECLKGWHGNTVSMEGFKVTLEADKVKGSVHWDNAGKILGREGAKIARTLIIRPSKRSKSIGKVKEIELFARGDHIAIRIR